MCVLVSQAAMQSGRSLPVAPGDALPPEVSTGTGARALGSAVVVASRAAVGSAWVLTPAELVVVEVVDPATVAPGLAPAVVVIVVGCDACSVVDRLGSAGVARS